MPRTPIALIVGTLCLAAALPAQAIVGGTATTAFAQVSNGVQFAPNWVLTARHIGLTANGIYSNGYGSSLVAARFDLGDGPQLVNDLALLRLSTPIDAPALDLLADLLPFGTLAVPMPVTLVTGSNQVPRGFAFGELSEVIGQIDPDDDGPLGLYDVKWLLTYDASHGAPYVQGGDSGGGLFLSHAVDSAGSALLGISSAQLQFDDSEGGGFGSGFVQLAAYRGWIDTTMADDLSDSQLARWVSAVPEPASWALWLGGAGLLAAALRRRRQAD